MQTSRHDDILSFLISHGKSHRLTAQALQGIKPFLDRVSDGSYELVQPGAFDPIATGRVITKVLGVKVTRLCTISRLGLLAGDPADGALAAKRYDGGSLAHRLMGRYSEVLAAGSRQAHREMLFNRLSEHLVDRLRFRSDGEITGDAHFGFWNQVRSGVGEALYFYLGLAMAGRCRHLRRLSLLVSLLLEAVPVGEPAGEPGSWVVLID